MRKSLSTLSTELSPSVAIEILRSAKRHVGTTPRAHVGLRSRGLIPSVGALLLKERERKKKERKTHG